MASKMCVCVCVCVCLCMVWEEELGREWVGGLKKVNMEVISEQSCEQKFTRCEKHIG